jgi:metal-responsive CopG/Arc/MetJ family transcriptional regulator
MNKNKRDMPVKRTPPLQRSVEIPDDMWEWLKEAAEERQTSRAGMIRILIATAMKKEKEKEGSDR